MACVMSPWRANKSPTVINVAWSFGSARRISWYSPMAWATLPWLRNFSAFSSALLLLKAMDDFRLPAPHTPATLFSRTDGLDMKVSTRQKQGATRLRGGGAKGDNSASWASGSLAAGCLPGQARNPGFRSSGRPRAELTNATGYAQIF